MPVSTTIKTVDSKGRVVLGPTFANSTVILTQIDPTEIVVSKARAVSERELWLLEHPEALASVFEGLRQTAAGETVEPPDVEADMEKARNLLKNADRRKESRA